jgi:raffinose/stachyose/melibiose transport system substrate-binding protein
MKRMSIKPLFMMIVILSVFLSACGNNNETNVTGNTKTNEDVNAVTNENSNVAEQPSEDPVDLRLLTWRVEDKAYFDEINAAFEEKYPYITIKLDAVTTADFATLFTARMAANEVDIFAGEPKNLLRTADQMDRLMDISDQPFLEGYMEDALKLGSVDGKTYMVPYSNLAMVTFYNKKIFADLGIEVPKTWDEFIAACEAIKAGGIDPIMFGGLDQWPVAMVMEQLDATVVRGVDADFHSKVLTGDAKMTDPIFVETLTKLQKISTYFQPNASGMGYGQAPGLFAQGKAAMMIDGSWSLAQIVDANPDIELGIMSLPGSDNTEYNKNFGMKSGGGWFVHKDTPNKDAAMKYLAFVSEKENYQKYINMVKMFPVMKDIKLNDPLLGEMADVIAANNQVGLWEDKMVPGGKYDYVNYGMQLVTGDITPEKAAENMQKELMDSKSDWIE